MSDVMLTGVLRMPYEMAMESELSRRQLHARAQQAAAEIERLHAEIERMQTAHFDIHARQAKHIDVLRPALAAVVEAMVPGVPPSRLVQHSEPWRSAALALWPDLVT